MVQDGYAWHYTYYSKDSRLARSQQLAREASRGLWAREQAIAPWDWRRGSDLLEDSWKLRGSLRLFMSHPRVKSFIAKTVIISAQRET